MTHFCSFRVTHNQEHDWAQGKERTSDIIHAEGVRGGCSSSAPKARRVALHLADVNKISAPPDQLL